MSSNSNMTPSPKQRNRFVSTLRRTLRSNPQPSSPATPPFGKTKASFSALLKSRDSSSSSPTSSGSSESSSPSSSTRSIQPTPSQRRYAAVFSKITFSNAEFIEDRYIYSQSPEKTDGHFRLPTQEPVPTEELMIPCPSFFAIPASRQPSVIEQSDIRLDQTTNPTEHRISFCGLSDSASPNSPLRSCFQEIFDLIDAGMSDEQFDDIIGDDISYEARNLPTAPASDSPYGLSGASGSNATLRLHQPDSSDEPLSHLVEAATIDEPVIAPECADAEKPIVAIEPSEECTTGESIQAFLQSLSSSLRNDPTEFSPRISEWDQESSRFSFQLDDELHSQERSAREDINYLNLRSSAYITQFPRFLKRTPARVKKNLPTRSA
ncbi:hypothetical protein MJO28_005049 [Puccinia striiformis f. sp. tritici]|uniref:Uncharacterized protein n=4 Tax=Puccinia striiformis TaxID=27350 RepID=A0A0L0VCG4_9BASI|nr:hypothetical protein Pst134EA_009202 [Puccinia striiformis f. sp. tritici]KAI9609369.1 hypothetical protein H4Q26_007322 [Puccinia striiformis f. sp. tritici PST-130]KNE96972.1 hypothetical protein PSTG_09707 [Puccinia striiformis f. sp. tritici PST-78]POW00394.1 hypothetical protein PSHT_13050 [Puccinia striiformis]KAH9457978.1 hypothetical protein Pst134EB_010278 [Puccinia striiformis f. sp. tritici]KAH9468668.1 hypothetical protein Pst134EA_009202 [Puccinia striiformis f. sp. tritici]